MFCGLGDNDKKKRLCSIQRPLFKILWSKFGQILWWENPWTHGSEYMPVVLKSKMALHFSTLSPSYPGVCLKSGPLCALSQFHSGIWRIFPHVFWFFFLGSVSYLACDLFCVDCRLRISQETVPPSTEFGEPCLIWILPFIHHPSHSLVFGDFVSLNFSCVCYREFSADLFLLL